MKKHILIVAAIAAMTAPSFSYASDVMVAADNFIGELDIVPTNLELIDTQYVANAFVVDQLKASGDKPLSSTVLVLRNVAFKAVDNVMANGDGQCGSCHGEAVADVATLTYNVQMNNSFLASYWALSIRRTNRLADDFESYVFNNDIPVLELPG